MILIEWRALISYQDYLVLEHSQATFKPFFDVNGSETFTAFPLFKTDDDALH